MTGRVVVFAGPTIGPDDVHAVLAGAVVRPPAARGDLLAQQWSPGDVAVIVDGYFRERRSVGHKEILILVDDGVEVIGTASMGALRAAELAPCGMRGVGAVYDMYATGEIDGDDEVGVLHGPAGKGYPPLTVALVNLRHAVGQAVRAKLIDQAAGERIVAAAKELPFTYRTWTDIARGLNPADRGPLPMLAMRIESGEWDLKRLDAIMTLREIGTRQEPAPDSIRGPVPGELPVTGIGQTQLLSRRSRREYAPGRWMSDLDVLDAARLFNEEYPEIHEQALTGILRELADERGLTLGGYAHAKLGLDERVELPDNLASWLTEQELARRGPVERLPLVMVRVWPIWQSVDWRPVVLRRLRSSPRWEQWCDIVAQADEVAEETRYKLAVPPPVICAKLFLRHWQQRGSSAEVELARRGFASLEELGAAVRRFFSYDVQRARGLAKAGAR